VPQAIHGLPIKRFSSCLLLRFSLQKTYSLRFRLQSYKDFLELPNVWAKYFPPTHIFVRLCDFCDAWAASIFFFFHFFAQFLALYLHMSKFFTNFAPAKLRPAAFAEKNKHKIWQT